MKKQGLKAVIIGATGLTGSHVLSQLLEDSRYEVVSSLSRKRTNIKHPKFLEFEVDLFDPVTFEQHMAGDHLFICTGTTKAKTPDAAEYYRIEHDLPLTVARVALKKGFSTVVAISALGADPDSRFSYTRCKGETERDIEKLDFEHAYFVQPALIGGDREEQRTFERLWVKVQRVIDPLLFGGLKKYRTIEPETIAAAMITVAVIGYSRSRIASGDLKKIVK